MNSISNILSNFFTKLIMFPLVFLLGYGLTLILAEDLMSILGYEVNTLKRLIISVVISSCISFLITVIWYGVVVKVFKTSKKSFMRRYHYTHLVLFYISGLITVLITIEPILIEEKLTNVGFGGDLKFSTLILFLSISNYTIFNSIIINDDFIFFKKDGSFLEDKNRT